MPVGQGAQTNDLGEFRIFGLPPGEYFVASSPRLTGRRVTSGSYVANASVPIRTGSQGASGGVGSYSIDVLRPRPSPNPSITVTDANVEGVQIIVQRPQ